MNKIISILYFSLIFSQIDTTVIIDVSSYNEWIYFSFNEGMTVDVPDPENSFNWDIAMQRKHIKTNSGLSGMGDGGAYVDSSFTWIEEWENIDSLPSNLILEIDTTLNDFYDPITHMFLEGIKNPALNSWAWFDEDYHLNVNHYVLFVKSSNGEEIVKFWPFNYYNQNGQGGHMSIRYQTGLSVPCDNIYGDINSDSIINVIDIVSIVNFIIYEQGLNLCELSVADMNADGFVNVVDIIAIVNIIIS